MNYTINIGGRLMDLSEPKVMGILNATPDSFYSASRGLDESSILQNLERLTIDGADIIDVGACSTRPGSSAPDSKEEIRRLRLCLGLLRKHFPHTVVSVDTYRSEVAKMSVEEYGVQIINDISGGTMDSEMFSTVSKMGIPYVLSHIQGTPSTMQTKTHYKNLIQDILYYFSERVQHLRDLGQKDIIIDPGFGFSKTTEQNYELLSRLDELQIFELPILAGISRKSMIFKVLDCSPEESLNGTTSLNMVCLMKGSNILRVHDVKACKEVIRLYTEFSVYDKNFEYNKRISRYEKC